MAGQPIESTDQSGGQPSTRVENGIVDQVGCTQCLYFRLFLHPPLLPRPPPFFIRFSLHLLPFRPALPQFCSLQGDGYRSISETWQHLIRPQQFQLPTAHLRHDCTQIHSQRAAKQTFLQQVIDPPEHGPVSSSIRRVFDIHQPTSTLTDG